MIFRNENVRIIYDTKFIKREECERGFSLVKDYYHMRKRLKKQFVYCESLPAEEELRRNLEFQQLHINVDATQFKLNVTRDLIIH